MNIIDLLIPIDFASAAFSASLANEYSLACVLKENQQSLPIDEADVYLLSIDGDVNGDVIREKLYALNRISATARVFDLGRLKRGRTTKDLYTALQEVSAFSVSQHGLLILLSADRNMESAVLSSYGGYDFNFVRIDSKLRLNSSVELQDSEGCMYALIQRFKNIFSLSYIGFQNYFSDYKELAYLGAQNTSMLRLGSLRDDMMQAEPLLRDAHCVSFDVEAMRSTDFPAQQLVNANGLRAEEACALAKYIGVGTEVRTVGLYGMCSEYDNRGQSASLAAQILWHVIDAYISGTGESPVMQAGGFEEYVVRFEDLNEVLIFYKSKLTDRWWLKINDDRVDEDLFVPCLEKDYKSALQLDLPDVWLKYIRKFKEK